MLWEIEIHLTHFTMIFAVLWSGTEPAISKVCLYLHFYNCIVFVACVILLFSIVSLICITVFALWLVQSNKCVLDSVAEVTCVCQPHFLFLGTQRDCISLCSPQLRGSILLSSSQWDEERGDVSHFVLPLHFTGDSSRCFFPHRPTRCQGTDGSLQGPREGTRSGILNLLWAHGPFQQASKPQCPNDWNKAFWMCTSLLTPAHPGCYHMIKKYCFFKPLRFWGGSDSSWYNTNS